METAGQRAARVLAALEDLVAQEAALLRGRDYERAAEIQTRTEPLIEFLLGVHRTGGLDPALRARLIVLHHRRKQTSETLGREIETTRGDLAQTRAAQNRVARIAPVYGSAPTRPSAQLLAVG